MNKQDAAAAELEGAAAAVRAFIDQCPEEVWSRAAADDGRTVASLAYHCAAGNDLALGWICQMLSLRPINETNQTHNAFNEAEAGRSAHMTKAEVAAALERTTERAARFLRALTDEELERSAMHGLAGRDRSVGQFMGNFGRHMRGHLETMSEAQKTG
jgi:DinB superfamily